MPTEAMAHVLIAYDGQPVRNGSMNVYQLGEALLAIGDLLNAGNRVLNGDRTVIDVTVRAEFKRGSFGVDFDVVQRTVEIGLAILPILPPSDIKSAGEIIKFLFEKGKGLVELLRSLKGKEPEKITATEKGTVRIEVRDSPNSKVTVLNYPTETVALYADLPARQAMERALRPLDASGMETFEVLDEQRKLQEVTAKETQYFRAPSPTELKERLNEDEFTGVYEVVSLSLFGGKGWRLSDSGGKKSIKVDIDDKEFLDQIAHHRHSFERGVVLKVRMHMTTVRKPDGSLDTKWRVVKVVDVIHFARPTQGLLLPPPVGSEPG